MGGVISWKSKEGEVTKLIGYCTISLEQSKPDKGGNLLID